MWAPWLPDCAYRICRPSPLQSLMTSHRIPVVLTALVAASFIALASPAAAQGPLPDAPPAHAIAPAVMPAAVIAPRTPEASHKFWDKENSALFISMAAIDTADFAVTRSNLQSGGQELNPVVRIFGRSSAGLAVNFAGETAGVMTVCYFFHKTGHHKLERAFSMVNIASSAGAVSYGLAHR